MDLIKSVIILVINKSDSHCTVLRFCYHSYDSWPNWAPLTASSYEPGNRDEFCGVFIWGISARSTEVNSRNTTKMVEHKLFATVTALWSLVTLLIKLIRILLKRKYIQDQNYAILAYMENWSVHMGDIGHKNRDLGNPASLASHMNTSIFLQRRVARRYLGNRASPVDRAHMKRPSVLRFSPK